MPLYPSAGSGISEAPDPGFIQDQIGGRPRTKPVRDANTRYGQEPVTEYDQGAPRWVDAGGGTGNAFEGQAPPQRIARLFDPGVSAWAGLQQHGAVQTGHRTRIRPFHAPPFVMRGVRSVRGVMFPDPVFTSGQARVPAIYVPTSVG